MKRFFDSDIDMPSLDRGFYPNTGSGIGHTQMPTTPAKYLNFAVEEIPSVEPLTTVAAPATFSIECAERLTLVEKAWDGNRDRHNPCINPPPL